MTAIFITPLEQWTRARMGLTHGQTFTNDQLAAFQLNSLNQTIARAAQDSPFYRNKWRDRCIPHLERLNDIGVLPFTTAEDIQQAPMEFLAVSQSEVARVVTLRTSGTTGAPKRIFFSDDDLWRTIAFFQFGMATLVRPGQRVLILLPGDLPDSVGDLLRKALARMDVQAVVHGLVQAPQLAIKAILDYRIDCVVGVPVQVLALVRHPACRAVPAGQVQSVLLSTDYVPTAIVQAIQAAWHCEVFQHYGMTEMGYGAAVSCAAHEGYHLREAELLFEIIDPQTLLPVQKGQMGEVVFTTLSHRAMPLIRYRTGDLAAWIDAPCLCGSVLRRMGWVQGRREALVVLKRNIRLNLADLDEVMFALSNVVDFQLTLQRVAQGDCLQLVVYTSGQGEPLSAEKVTAVLAQVPAVRMAMEKAGWTLAPIKVVADGKLTGRAVKRNVVDNRLYNKLRSFHDERHRPSSL